MKEIYKSALRKARALVFDNNKYEKIISFCKYKLDPNVYTRNEIITTNKHGREIKTKVFVTSNPTRNFCEYQQKTQNNTTKTKYIIL